MKLDSVLIFDILLCRARGREQGQHHNAMSMHWLCLSLRKKLLGIHPQTMQALVNVASSLFALGNYLGVGGCPPLALHHLPSLPAPSLPLSLSPSLAFALSLSLAPSSIVSSPPRWLSSLTCIWHHTRNRTHAEALAKCDEALDMGKRKSKIPRMFLGC